MPNPRLPLFVVMACALMAGSSVAMAAEVTVVSAARIHTVDPDQPQAQAMAYDEAGRILALGTTDALLARFPEAARIDAGAGTIVPGLIDAHGHVGDLGEARMIADLIGAASKEDVVQRLQVFAQTNPGDGWLVGNGWDQNDWPERRFPTAADLDDAFPERPVWLVRVDGHAGWANSAALRAVERELQGDWQPEGGRIERDQQGRPTGILVDAAMQLVDDVRPAPDAATVERMLTLGMQAAVAAGLTGVHDAGVPLAELRAYQRLAERGALPLRITAMADGDDQALAELCRTGRYRHASGRLQMRTVKLYADGALGSRGAALLQDYSDDPGNRGLMVMSPQQLLAAAGKASRCGVQVATHAIGDRGNHEVLAVYEQVLGEQAAGDHRWRIEHAQVLAPQDLPRLAQLRVIASMQPTHATSDMPWAEDRLGADRIGGAYAWRQVRDSGARLALGSDFPVESVEPRLGLYAATTRADADGNPPGGWRPQEKLSPEEALRGFTLDAAYAGFAEGEVGSLEPGKRADFVILGEDPLSVPPGQLRTLSVRATYVDGKPVYEAGKAGSAATP